MGFRFRKSISILPGLKLNISKSGISTTVGTKGASMNIGSHGVKGTVGIPGSGLSYSQQLFKNNASSKSQPQGYHQPFSIQVEDDGTVLFINEYNQVIDDATVSIIKKQYKDEIHQYLLKEVNERNEVTEQISHIEQYFGLTLNDFRNSYGYQQASYGQLAAIEDFLASILPQIQSPLKFSGSFEVECKEGIWLDIDLPEIEEIPPYVYSVTKSNTVSKKTKTQKQIKEEYSKLISGIAIIIANVVFLNFPTVEAIVLSGYTQRINRANGREEDQYVYSLHIEKNTFMSLNLLYIDPIMALSNFNPIWNVSSSLEWKTISPYYRT